MTTVGIITIAFFTLALTISAKPTKVRPVQQYNICKIPKYLIAETTADSVQAHRKTPSGALKNLSGKGVYVDNAEYSSESSEIEEMTVIVYLVL
ncbi:unnamed protein product [Gongylonema pulchrum]|uniref:Secreted protein n=1 Tax=Gongylonema pulchrum TaxID=637853 RepID=A0A183CWD8_9BILA|nr:unnamed protein product [Gongylonema pulchrum]